MKTYIKNVAVLDMRKATPERVEAIERIDNVAVVLASAETMPLVPSLNIGNIALAVEIPDGVELIMLNGSHTLSDLSGDKPLYLMANGSLTLDEALSPETIREAVAGGMINGVVFARQDQMGALSAAGVRVNGKTNVYPENARLRSARTSLTVEEARAADRSLYLTRRVLIENGASAALADKGLSLYGEHGAILGDAEAEAFYRAWKGDGKVLRVPVGFTLMEGEQAIRRAKAPLLRGRRYILGDLILYEDVDMDSLAALEALIVTGKLLLPEALLAPMLNILKEEPELIPYRGTLMRLEGEHTLTADMLLTDGQLALYVDGVLQLSPELTPQVLRAGISMLHADGVLRMSQAQWTALVPVILGGDFQTLTDSEDEEDEEEFAQAKDCHVVKNAAQYVL